MEAETLDDYVALDLSALLRPHSCLLEFLDLVFVVVQYSLVVLECGHVP